MVRSALIDPRITPTMFDPGQLLPYGWNDTLSDTFDNYPADGREPGRVIRVDRGRCDVAAPAGVVRALAGEHTLCTGDWVTLHRHGDELAVADLLPRRSAIVRASASGRSEGQLLAANVDTVVIAAGLDTALDLGRIERLLALVWESGAQPVVALTKSDTVQDVSLATAEVAAVAPGATVLAVSADTGDGIDVLTAVIDGTVALIGPSGAGKSTLANALLGEDVLATGRVREGDHKGRHTTAHRELLPLPSGGALIDTPGLRGVGMWDAADGIDKTFPEIEELAAQCRFADCSHTAEPGCAVQGVVERGELPERRLSTVASISNTIRYVLTLSTTRIGEAAQYLGPSAVRTRTAASEGRLPSRRTGFGGPKL
ncbi:ribosome small subunit-dependent GTPase A [Rhodococcus opacus]|uniref:Small ribosomal subunit biogenesis GTPase RsgA n=1 Tax=Rhodococcus opacus TaxID=37919 RepID=A0AAX3YHA7_RHOOP|nr:ribosome small subunit-dependent GTPase A [Rhodococcus opacus]MCZ4584037.1 ribosome small subunit-dependent GTPase A [Rhodococcus opacus]WLF47834.1 ribosome small subunit-dependent GTPase A [Rhodococcus opacus]